MNIQANPCGFIRNTKQMCRVSFKNILPNGSDSDLKIASFSGFFKMLISEIQHAFLERPYG